MKQAQHENDLKALMKNLVSKPGLSAAKAVSRKKRGKKGKGY